MRPAAGPADLGVYMRPAAAGRHAEAGVVRVRAALRSRPAGRGRGLRVHGLGRTVALGDMEPLDDLVAGLAGVEGLAAREYGGHP